MVDKSEPAMLQKIFRELMKLRDNVEEFKQSVDTKFQDLASRMGEQSSRMDKLEHLMLKSPPLSGVGSSTGSTNSDSRTNSSVSVLSSESTHVSKRRILYENNEFKYRNHSNIDSYLQNLVIPPETVHLERYCTLIRAANVRSLSYEEFITVEDIVKKFKKKRPKKGKGVTGISDDRYRAELLSFVSSFHEAVFDPEYVCIYIYKTLH